MKSSEGSGGEGTLPVSRLPLFFPVLPRGSPLLVSSLGFLIRTLLTWLFPSKLPFSAR